MDERQQARSHRSGQGYRKLVAFRAAHELVKATYEITARFPKSEQFGLTSQMRRAAVSVAANIVEGHALSTTALFVRHLAISFGSCKELEYYFELAGELGYMDDAELLRACRLEGQTAYLISALSRGLKNRATKASPVACSQPPAADSSDSYDSSDSSRAVP